MGNPLYGQNKADALIDGLSSRIKIRKFQIDYGAQAAGVATTESFAAGTIILWWSALCSESATSGGSATLELGFTGTKQYSAGTIALADLAAGKVHTSLITDSQPLMLNAADTFDSKVATATMTAGKVDVEVYYLEPSAMVDGEGPKHVTA
tara:strand:+ start:55 stop:507 length:453 start_codon:yes stop_codon:yes gene_type:complete